MEGGFRKPGFSINRSILKTINRGKDEARAESLAGRPSGRRAMID